MPRSVKQPVKGTQGPVAPSHDQQPLMGVFGVPLSSEGGQIAIEVMTVHNLPVAGLVNAVQVVPHPHAVVNAGAHQLAA